MMGRRTIRTLPAALVAVALWTCDGGPKAGEIVAELVGPHSSLGAASFLTTALDPFTVDTVTAACTGCTVYMTRVSATEVRGIVTGRFGSEPVLRVTVSDRGERDPYTVRLLELATPDYSTIPISGSSLRFQ
jgi:hypothetical protein